MTIANIQARLRSFNDRNGFNFPSPGPLGRTWHVDTINGSDSNDGRFAGLGLEFAAGHAFSTMAKALANVDEHDTVVMTGVVKEQVVAPAVYDVTIIGGGNLPRQATSGGVATGGGSSWLAPAAPAATTPLIRVVAQAWRFINIQFAPVAASACITFDRRETAAIPDSSHGVVENCYFAGGGAAGHGVEIIEVKRIQIRKCEFEAISGTAIKGTAGDGIAAPNHHFYEHNYFNQNANDINLVSDFGLIRKNVFNSTNPIEGGTRLKLNGSTGRNRVLLNHFSDVAADVTIAKGYTPAANDVWANYVAGTAAIIVTVPA